MNSSVICNEKGFLQDLQRADLSLCDNSRSFLQSGFWGCFKAKFEWEALAFRAVWKKEHGGDIEKPLLVLYRTLAPGFALAYVPWGPELPEDLSTDSETRWAALGELASSLGNLLPRNTAFIRFDPAWPMDGGDRDSARHPPFTRSIADIQAPDTVILDLSQSIESIKEQMKPKWRYNAQLAIKKGITVNQAGSEKTEIFYELLKETAHRDKIAIHGIGYYKNLIANCWYSGKKPDIRLYLAEHDGDILAGIVTLFSGAEAIYLYGASSNNKRNLMAPYALQMRALEDAKQYGCLYYDFFGIPPNENPAHPMAGLYRFKTGFGGNIVKRSGCWDFAYKPFFYRIFYCAEKLRRFRKKIVKNQKR